MRWLRAGFNGYVAFRGRARRREFWLYMLCFTIVNSVIRYSGGETPSVIRIYFPLLLIPTLSVIVRRLHDAGHTAYALFLLLLPVVGPIILLFYFCGDSESGINRYGPNPKFRPVPVPV